MTLTPERLKEIRERLGKSSSAYYFREGRDGHLNLSAYDDIADLLVEVERLRDQIDSHFCIIKMPERIK